MIKKVSHTAKVYNPFADNYEFPICEWELHIDRNEIDGVDLISVVTDEHVEMIDYLSEKEIENINDYFNENLRGLI